MALSFPTGHASRGFDTHGTPRHARPCQCDQPLVCPHSHQCVRCGKYPKATISQTWEQRAQVLSLRAHRKRAAA